MYYHKEEFTLFKRKSKKGIIYYYYFYDENGNRKWRSTGAKSRIKAMQVILNRITNGTLHNKKQ